MRTRHRVRLLLAVVLLVSVSVLVAGVALLARLAWMAVELRWRYPDIDVRSPVYRNRE